MNCARARWLEDMPLLRAVLGLREDLRAGFGHQEGVLELGGEAAVLGAYGPFVIVIEHGLPGANVEHRLDREADAGRDNFARVAGMGKVRDARVLVELTADPVALVLFHDLATVGAGMVEDGGPDVDDSTVRLDRTDPAVKTVKGHLHQSSRGVGNLADQESLRL